MDNKQMLEQIAKDKKYISYLESLNRSLQNTYTAVRMHMQEKNQEIEDLQAEITELKQQLEAKHKAFIFLDDCRKEWHKSFMFKCEQLEDLKKKLARYENPDYVLVPREPTKAMMDAGDEKQDYTWVYVDEIYKAMIEAVEIEDGI